MAKYIVIILAFAAVSSGIAALVFLPWVDKTPNTSSGVSKIRTSSPSSPPEKGPGILTREKMNTESQALAQKPEFESEYLGQPLENSRKADSIDSLAEWVTG